MGICLHISFHHKGTHIFDTLSSYRAGRGGARLSHSHERQYAYVLQSLSLWREISTDMFRLWYLAELDLLSPSCRYRLCDTGQGLHRVQPARQVAKAMAQILARCQQQIGTWVGSSVVHLGDSNVPNALMFIDKYTQVRCAAVKLSSERPLATQALPRHDCMHRVCCARQLLISEWPICLLALHSYMHGVLHEQIP
jgi:hypothetical protein